MNSYFECHECGQEKRVLGPPMDWMTGIPVKDHEISDLELCPRCEINLCGGCYEKHDCPAFKPIDLGPQCV